MTTRRNLMKATLGGGALALGATALGPARRAAGQEPIEIRVHSNVGVDGDVVRQRSAEMTAENPAVVVVPELFVQAEYFQKFQVLIAGGQLGDVMFSSTFTGTYPLWAARNVYTPLDDFLAAEDFDPSPYFPAAWVGQTVNGQIYGITYKAHPSSALLYYNRTMFDAAGLPEPTDEMTLDEFVEAAEALTAGDVFGYYAQPSHFQHYPTAAQQFGRQLFSADGMTAHFNSEESIAALRFDYDNIHVRGIHPPRELAPENPRDLFVNGRVAMYKSGTWDISLGKQIVDAFEWGMVQFPVGPGGDRAAVFTQDCMGVTEASPHKAEAWEVVKGLTNQRTGILLGLGGEPDTGNSGTAGGRIDVYESKELQTNPDYTPEVNEARYRALQAAVPLNLAHNYRMTEIQTVVTAAMDELWAGTAPEQAWADEVNSRIQDILAEPI
ncbi:MAG: sugar ABC transporter substrate-binding protein [Chloroflexia bacterium]|nr:sugar ABC transporter substrate-binding protein [Chloroflexia bacterium]